MNARMREPCEVPVDSTEKIQADLALLRIGLDHVKADVGELKADSRSLRDKVDQNYHTLGQGQTTLRDKIDATRAELSDRIEQLGTELRGSIGQVRAEQKTLQERLEAKIEEGDKDLGKKIDQLSSKVNETNVAVARIAAMQKAVLWAFAILISLLGLIPGVFAINARLRWF